MPCLSHSSIKYEKLQTLVNITQEYCTRSAINKLILCPTQIALEHELIKIASPVVFVLTP